MYTYRFTDNQQQMKNWFDYYKKGLISKSSFNPDSDNAFKV